MPLDPTRRQARLAQLRDRLAAAGAPAMLVSTPHNIEYLTGFRGTAGVLAVSLTGASLVVDSRYAVAARRAVGDDGIRVVLAASLDTSAAGILNDSGAGPCAVEAGHLTLARYRRLAGLIDGGEDRLLPTERLVEELRAVKDAGEQATLREAGRLLAGVARRAIEMPRPGRREAEVATEIDAALRSAGFERPAFDTIVASGPNSALPHHRPGGRVLQPGDGLVLDFGGVYDGYCVDLTRTVQLLPWTERYQGLVAAVAAAQRAAIASVRPGVTTETVDAAARDSLQAAGLGEAFGHATGHGLGLDVHEEPRVGPPRDGATPVTLVAGMIFTVEPGAYIEGFGGVRIEDDVLVTPEGCDVLTRDS